MRAEAVALTAATARRTGAPPVLCVAHLVRRYGARTVVRDVSFDMMPGEIFAIVGPNGAGKSTLFRMLLCVERVDEGQILLDGAELKPGNRALRRRLSGVFQHPVLFSGSVRDNIGFGLRGMSRAVRRRAVDAALDWFDLGGLATADVRTLSGGEARRVTLARALVLEPDVLLLDEPTAGLDASVRTRFLHELERVARSRTRGIIMITHDPRDAFGLADRIAVMHHGQFVQQGTPDDIMLRPATVFAAELTGAELLLNGTVAAVEYALAAVHLPGGVELHATIAAGEVLQPGDAAQVAYRPEDVVVARGVALPSSAANRLAVNVVALVVAGAHVRAQLRPEGGGDYVLSALLTRRSVEELGIEVGQRVHALLKASALHVWRRGDSGPFTGD
jgi:molybdopterin-binding protein